jgi:nucleoside-diphosphate-sugar epimerase
MMYMPDAVLSLVQVAEADVAGLQHHADFNVNAMSFAPEELQAAIRKNVPDFVMDYDIDPLRQSIADSWPNFLDDSAARMEWGWSPKYDLEAMVDDMMVNLSRKLAEG